MSDKNQFLSEIVIVFYFPKVEMELKKSLTDMLD